LTNGQILVHHTILAGCAHRRLRKNTLISSCDLSLLAFAMLMVSSGPLRAASTGCGSEVLSEQQARAAIAFVRTQVHSAHYTERFDSDGATLRQLTRLSAATSASLTSSVLAHRINMALQLAQDAHLRLELPPEFAADCPALPLTLSWTDDGLIVLRGSEIPSGSRIASIADRALDTLQMLASEAIPHENEFWVRSSFARHIVRADQLAAFGLADPDGSVRIDFRAPDGALMHVHLRPSTPIKAARPWVGYEFYPADSTAVFWLERCDPNDEFFSTLSGFVNEVRQQNLRKVVIDLRGNPGGDSSVAVAILRSMGQTLQRGFSVAVRVSPELLHDMPIFAPAAITPAFHAAGLAAPEPEATRYTVPGSLILRLLDDRLAHRQLDPVSHRSLYLLTDGGTFSSAALFAVLVRDNGLGLLVGEPTGNSVTFNGSEIERVVPGMRYVLHLSTAKLIRPDEVAGSAPTLLPDLRAPQTAASIRAGHDAALDLIRSRSAGETTN
jgi:peptidase S41-like protein